MASESDDSDLRERVAELEATVEQQQATIKKMLPGRRGALKAGGLLAGGGLLGALGSDQAAAADGTQDTSAGTIGAAGDSNDIYLDQLYDPDGDEILNVDDTGDINAAFGRTWAFNDISVPNFSPDSIDTNSLTTDQLNNIPQQIVIEKTSSQTISSGSPVKLSWDQVRSNLNPDVDLNDYVDLSNDQFSIPSNPDFDYARVRCHILTGSAVTINQFNIQKNTGADFDGAGQESFDRTSARTDMVMSDWVPISAGDRFLAKVELETDDSVESDSRTYLSLEVR